MDNQQERVEARKAYFSKDQLDELEREIKTSPTDGDGHALPVEFTEQFVRGTVLKLIVDIRNSLDREEQLNNQLDDYDAKIAELSSELHAWKSKQELINILKIQVAEQDKEIQRYKEALTPSVVYSAIRHYYKQGLFEQDELGDIENAMDLIGNLTK